MANAEGSSTSSMTFPLSLTDFVKALRELVGLVKDTGQLIGDGAQLYDRRRCKKAAERLYVLSFTPQGMRSPLKRIAAGQGTGEDFGLIERLLLESASRVEENLGKLLAFKDRLREQVSWEAANVLDEIISGPVDSRVTPSPTSWSSTRLRSAWTAGARGATTCSSSASGAASN